jgi:hypothetical protein
VEVMGAECMTAAGARGAIEGGADIIGKPGDAERGGVAATGAREATAGVAYEIDGMLQGGRGGGPRVSSIGRRVGRLCDEGPATCAEVDENSQNPDVPGP